MKRILTLLLLLSTTIFYGQKSISELTDIVLMDLDEKGNLFAVDKNSNVYKISEDPKQNFNYSPEMPALPTILDASNSTKIILFSQEKQEIVFLDWLMSPIGKYSFDPTQFEYVALVSQNSLNSIWVLDNVKMALMKLNTALNKVVVETPLEMLLTANFEPLWMKEYQNFLYISTAKNGILVFDNLGNYKKTLPFQNVRFFHFFDNKLKFIENDKLVEFDLKTLQVAEKEINIEVSKLLEDQQFWFYLSKEGKLIKVKK